MTANVDIWQKAMTGQTKESVIWPQEGDLAGAAGGSCPYQATGGAEGLLGKVKQNFLLQ